MRPVLLPEAEHEINEAAAWYDTARSGLALEFIVAVDRVLRTIGERPLRYPLWQPDLSYRRVVVPRFPYLVFYHLTPQGPEVVAVAHSRREPGYWLKRRR